MQAHRNRGVGPEFMTRRPREALPSSGWAKPPLPEPNDRFCTPAGVLLRRRPFRSQGNCNERTRHTRYIETNLLATSSCPDRGPLGKPDRCGVQPRAASAPIHHRLFEYSWRREYSGTAGGKTSEGKPQSILCLIKLKHQSFLQTPSV